MFDFIEMYNLNGLTVGLLTFLIIGLFHPLVIKAEYYLGTRSWLLFFIFGLLCVLLSLFWDGMFLSTVAGVLAFSSFWSIREVFQQAERVRKGWFPSNPKRYSNKP
jgi:hypothetical protein